jgi:ATP phosphoribosyltransferase
MSRKPEPITFVIPKGRIAEKLCPLLERAGIDTACLAAQDRRLVRESTDGRYRFLQVKPDDVPTYVEYGVADLGISGRDTLLERRYDLYQLVELRIGQCRLVVAGPRDPEDAGLGEESLRKLVEGGTGSAGVLRVATKYPAIASEYFARKGIHPEVIYVAGSVELAPLVGLADVIVDLVETGDTLRQNGLVERELVADISSVLIANRALFKLRHRELSPLVAELARAAGEAPQ